MPDVALLPGGFRPLAHGELINEGRGPGNQVNPDGKTPKLPELMSSATDALGVQSQWTYYPLSSKAGRGSSDLPLYQVPGPGPGRYVDERHFYFTSSMPVVSSLWQSNGVGGLNETRYGYEEAMYHGQGRGFQGFRAISVDDRTPGAETRSRTLFHQKFPLTGQIEQRETFAVVGGVQRGLLSSETLIWRCRSGVDAVPSRGAVCPSPLVASPSGVWFPFVDSQTSTSFDLTTAEAGGSAPLSEVRVVNAASEAASASGFDVYGNLTARLRISRDLGSVDLVEQREASQWQFAPADLGSWWLDKLENQSETRTVVWAAGHAPPAGVNVGSQSLSTRFTWLPGSQRLLQTQTVQPGVAGQESTTTFSYTGHGLPESTVVSSPSLTALNNQRTTLFGYSLDGYFVSSTRNPAGHLSLARTRPRDGQVELATDPLNNTLMRVFDPFGQVIAEMSENPNTVPATVLAPDRRSALLRCINCDGAAGAVLKQVTVQEGTPTTTRYLDPLGRVVQSRSTIGAGGYSAVRSSYDAAGRAVSSTAPALNGAVGVASTQSFDRLGRVLRKVEPAGDGLVGRQSLYRYEGRRVRVRVRPDNQSAAWDFACATSIASQCFEVSREADSLGRIVRAYDQGGSRSRYWFDGAGNPSGIEGVDGQTTKAEYNALGQRVALSDPDMGAWSFQYDALGELVWQRDARGVVVTQSFDALGRLLTRDSSAVALGVFGSRSIADRWNYDASGPGLTDSASRSLAGIGTIWSQSYRYDPARRPFETQTQMYQLAEPLIERVQYHSQYGWVKARDYPSGLSVATRNTKYGVLKDIGDGNAIWYAETQWDARGNPTQQAFGNGIMATSSFISGSGQMKSRVLTAGTGATLDRWDYQYDGLSNLSRSQRSYDAILRSESYVYDNRQRLITAARSNAPAVNTSYAANGNPLAKSDYGSQYQYIGYGPHAVSKVVPPVGAALTYAYDQNGNLTGGNTLSAQYDHDNKPWFVQRSNAAGQFQGSDQFLYGADGERFYHQDSQGTLTYYGAGGYERIQKNGTLEHRHHLPGLIVGFKSGGTLSEGVTKVFTYRHQDRLGSTVALSDSQGKIIERRSFDAFGQTRNGDFSDKPNGTLAFSGPETHGFTEHEHLDSTFLIHMNGRAGVSRGTAARQLATAQGCAGRTAEQGQRSRTYDYRLGRFLAVDPFIQFPTNSQSLNPYSYILNNPLSGTDPTGYLANCGDISSSSGGSGTCTFEQDGKSIDVAYSSNDKGVSVTASNGGSGARLLAAISASDSGAKRGNSAVGANRTDSGSKNGETTAANLGHQNRNSTLQSNTESFVNASGNDNGVVKLSKYDSNKLKNTKIGTITSARGESKIKTLKRAGKELRAFSDRTQTEGCARICKSRNGKTIELNLISQGAHIGCASPLTCAGGLLPEETIHSHGTNRTVRANFADEILSGGVIKSGVHGHTISGQTLDEFSDQDKKAAGFLATPTGLLYQDGAGNEIDYGPY
ncbi:MAG: RHS repeat-associated core domain-containing protein [Lysobacterales bacterium]